MDEADVRRLIAIAQSGEKHLAIDARNQIVMANMRLVYYVVHKYSYKAPMDELVQQGTLGLLDAIDAFDLTRKSSFEDRHVKFSTFAVLRILLPVRRMLLEPPYTGAVRVPSYLLKGETRSTSRFINEATIACKKPSSLSIRNDYGAKTDIPDSCLEPLDELALAEDTERTSNKLDTLVSDVLNDIQKQVIELVVKRGYKLKEASEILGRSVVRIQQIKTAALYKLRKALKQ